MSRPSKPEDWEQWRETIAHLYVTMNMTLNDVMTEMVNTYGFKATLKQYKTHIKQWGLDTKYIKSSEYLAMIKLQRDRANEKPPRESYFTLRGRPVDPKDITRFEKRAAKKGNPIPKKIEVDPEALEELEVYDQPVDEQYAYGEADAQYTYDQSGYTAATYSSGYASTSYDQSQYDPNYSSGYTY